MIGVAVTTMSARDFNRDVSAAKRAADDAPVVITDRGRAAYVLLSAPTYEQLTDKCSIVDWLQMRDDTEFEPARLTSLPRAADL
jgi:prevent-host-death family protein